MYRQIWITSSLQCRKKGLYQKLFHPEAFDKALAHPCDKAQIYIRGNIHHKDEINCIYCIDVCLSFAIQQYYVAFSFLYNFNIIFSLIFFYLFIINFFQCIRQHLSVFHFYNLKKNHLHYILCESLPINSTSLICKKN